MSEEKPQIKFPEESGSVGPSFFEKQTKQKFRNIDTLIYAVVLALVITAISALISVGAIIIDQLHFNNLTYREFSRSKDENIELLRKINELEKRTDRQDQQIEKILKK